MMSSSLLRFRMKTRKRNIQAVGNPQNPISESSRSPNNKKFRKEERMGRSILTRSGLSPSVALICYNIEEKFKQRQYVQVQTWLAPGWGAPAASRVRSWKQTI